MSTRAVEPFTIAVPDHGFVDLRDRLAKTRWPDEIDNSAWRYGAKLSYLQDLCDYWRTKFDWRKQERFLNGFHHFRTRIDGQGLHFIHENGKGPNPLPLVITHGWPSTFFEMVKLIPLLTDPAAHGGDPKDAFDVVAPSLPGYGFSDRPIRAGLTTTQIADLWAGLMTDALGYKHFAAHGGDIGSGVTAWLGRNHPDKVIGIHITAARRPFLGEGSKPLSDAEKAYVELNRQWEEEEGAYSHVQGTRPQTLAYGLNDSPAGLAAWILEKYRSWSDCGGDIESRFTKDELLTNLSLYWVTQTINSSMRLYYEHRHLGRAFGKDDFISVPTGVCLTVEPVDRCPREWAERLYNVQRYTLMPRGGHFAAMEEPQLLAEDIRAFFRPLR